MSAAPCRGAEAKSKRQIAARRKSCRPSAPAATPPTPGGSWHGCQKRRRPLEISKLHCTPSTFGFDELNLRTDMTRFFLKASKFNQDLSKWDTALVLDGDCTDFAVDSSCPIDKNSPNNTANKDKQTCAAKLQKCVIDTEV